MKSLPEKTIPSLLQQDPQSILGFIQKKVLELNKLNQIWKTENSSDLAQHSRIANFRDNCLVIEVDNAAWATRLRFLLPELTKKLASYPILSGLKHIEWYIQPYFPPTIEKLTSHPVLTEKSARLLKSTAKSIKAEALQSALAKLARNT
jgi:hypothetical protein